MSYTITPARYAKGKVVMQEHNDSGYKTRAAYLAEALGGRYVGRSHGYVMSPAAADKLKRLYAAGFDAHVRLFNSSPVRIVHYGRGLDGLSVREALALI